MSRCTLSLRFRFQEIGNDKIHENIRNTRSHATPDIPNQPYKSCYKHGQHLPERFIPPTP
jgi:hypothetical protein